MAQCIISIVVDGARVCTILFSITIGNNYTFNPTVDLQLYLTHSIVIISYNDLQEVFNDYPAESLQAIISQLTVTNTDVLVTVPHTICQLDNIKLGQTTCYSPSNPTDTTKIVSPSSTSSTSTETTITTTTTKHSSGSSTIASTSNRSITISLSVPPTKSGGSNGGNQLLDLKIMSIIISLVLVGVIIGMITIGC